MASFNKLFKESTIVVATVAIAQDYVCFDDEFMSHKKVQKNKDNQTFWIDVAHMIIDAAKKQVVGNADMEGFDDQNDGIADVAIFNYIMDLNNRMLVNDMICDAVESWISFH